MPQKVVGFAPVNNIILSEYVNNQLNLIKIEYPELEIELSDETDTRLLKYAKIPDRFPCFMLFKNEIFKTAYNAKVSDKEILIWINNKKG